jgi:hypothetical protein
MFIKLRLLVIRKDLALLCYSIIASLPHRYMLIFLFVNVSVIQSICSSLASAQMDFFPSLTSLAGRTSKGPRPLLVLFVYTGHDDICPVTIKMHYLELGLGGIPYLTIYWYWCTVFGLLLYLL